ncbi:unnamed protein product [Orchesella dallaii]|uniref:Uncharacterized protein n=1 Tax=Orchesella dallaii TaxID=48710 RepID=A0ABP1Q4N0_9HEXA
MEPDSSEFAREEYQTLPVLPEGVTTQSKEIIVIKPQRVRKRRPSKKHQLEPNLNKRRRSSILTKPPFQNLNLTGFHHLPNIGPNSLTILLGEALLQYFQEHEGSLTDTEAPNQNRTQQDLHLDSNPTEPQVIDEEIKQEANQDPDESENNNNQSGNNLSPVSSRPLKRSNPSVSLPKAERDGSPAKIPKKKKKKRSSDSSKTPKKKTIKFENPPAKELGDQWLHFTESEQSLADTRPVELDYGGKLNRKEDASKSDVLMKEMSLYFKILKWTGRMPHEMKRCLDFTVFYENHNGWNYRLYCTTSIIMTLMLSVMMGNFIVIFYEKGVSDYEEIELLEFDKYWSFALFTLFNLWYVVISSLFTIFHGSFHLNEYMTRWNICCNLLGFDTSYRLQSITRRELYFITFYGLLLIAGMIADSLFSDWNGCFGFLSTLLLRKCIRRFRVSNHYGWLRWIGLLIHIYSILASRLMSATIILYCRALENAARQFNFRLVCMLGNVGEVRNDGKVIILRRMIPYKMLLAEHLAITTFSRNIGNVFSVGLIAFIIVKALTIIIAAYNLVLIINGAYTPKEDHDVYNRSGVEYFEETKISIPIKYYISVGTAFLILGVITFFSWGTFWHTTECIHDAGAAIMQGIGYIQRHGLMLCKSSKERRFVSHYIFFDELININCFGKGQNDILRRKILFQVLSMQSSFHPKNDYFINGINRQYIFGFVALLVSYSVTLLGFSIQRLSNKEIFLCGDGRQCINAIYNPRTPGFDLSGLDSLNRGGEGNLVIAEAVVRKAITKTSVAGDVASIPKVLVAGPVLKKPNETVQMLTVTLAPVAPPKQKLVRKKSKKKLPKPVSWEEFLRIQGLKTTTKRRKRG